MSTISRTFVVGLAFVFAVSALSSCKSESGTVASGSNTDGSSNNGDLPAALAGFRVAEGDPTLLFQYVSGSEGQWVATPDSNAVPEPARSRVVVLPTRLPKGSLPPEVVIVADLNQKNADGSFPFRLVSRFGIEIPDSPASGQTAGGQGATDSTQRSGPSVGNSSVDDAEVVLFTTSWCGYCRKARSWFQSKGIKFVEKDVEKDSTAVELLRSAAMRQGIPAQQLTAVPIIMVKGRLLIGFDPGQVEAALATK